MQAPYHVAIMAIIAVGRIAFAHRAIQRDSGRAYAIRPDTTRSARSASGDFLVELPGFKEWLKPEFIGEDAGAAYA